MIHEISDAPPAVLAAVMAPSSQPEPMIDPSEIMVRPLQAHLPTQVVLPSAPAACARPVMSQP